MSRVQYSFTNVAQILSFFSHVNSCFCFLFTTVVVLCARVESDASNKSSRIIPVRGFALILDSNKSVNLIKVSRAHNLFLAW